MNAARVVGKDITDLTVVISGSGAAGVAVTKILHEAGVSDIVVLDSKGIVESGRDDLTETKKAIAANSNPRGLRGDMKTALDGADVFIGLSSGTVDPQLLGSMADDAIIFALSNPNPEVRPTSPPSTRRSSPPGAATSPIRSTTSSHSPVSSAEPSTPVPRTSPRR